MLNKLKRIGILLSVIFNIAFIGGYCYKTFWRPADISGFIRPTVFKELNLSKEQKETIRRSLGWAIAEVSKIRAQIKTKRLEMIELLASPVTDKEAIEIRRQEIVGLQEEVQKLVLNKLIENKEVLTPQQQRKLFSYLKERIKDRTKGVIDR